MDPCGDQFAAPYLLYPTLSCLFASAHFEVVRIKHLDANYALEYMIIHYIKGMTECIVAIFRL